MKIEIDQSGKIEDTRTHTIMALSNGISYSIMIKAVIKRIIKNIYILAGKPKIYTIQVFSLLVYLLLEKSTISSGMVIIDKEYKGQDNLIKSYITQLIHIRKKVKLSKEDIHFTQIGKKSKAHITAISAYRSKKADYIVKEDEIIALSLLLRNEKSGAL